MHVVCFVSPPVSGILEPPLVAIKFENPAVAPEDISVNCCNVPPLLRTISESRTNSVPVLLVDH